MEINSFNVTIFIFMISSVWIQPSVEIVNGKDADITEFPWTVTINWYMSICPICNDFNCGGTIISEKWILTAAHCDAKTHVLGGFLIRAGSNSPLWWGDRIYINKTIPHPQYNSATKEHDIQLIKLSKNITRSDKIKPIRMADKNFTVTENLDVKIAGFGLTCGDCSYSGSLLKADLTTCEPITNQTKSAMDAKEVNCAHDKNELQAICGGDSGNGLVFVNAANEALLIGVLGQGYCTGTRPSTYASVPAYREWIKSVVGF